MLWNAVTAKVRESAQVARRTEGRLWSLLAVVVLLSVVTGIVGWVEFEARSDGIEGAEQRIEVADAALKVERALATTDALSFDVVLATGERVPHLRREWKKQLDEVSRALAPLMKRGVGEGVELNRISGILALLPEYAGTVEAGWRELEAKHVVGTAYLSTASNLVRGSLLEMAQALRQDQATAIREAHAVASAPPWGTAIAGTALLVTLIVAQVFVTRRTRRRVNLGLVSATVLTLFILAGSGIVTALLAVKSDVNADASAHVDKLAEALRQVWAVDGTQARTLIFPRVTDSGEMEGALRDIDRVAADEGDAEKVHQATDMWRKELARPDSPADEFQSLAEGASGGKQAGEADGGLRDLIEPRKDAANDATRSALALLVPCAAVVALAMAGAIGGAVHGLGMRIREYYR
ncbi:hypothetical protein AB0I60_21670 [Actinosynnema sp. NPDC050436]|uniref:hypothetical protein n=1 Tax=Actinosynnema sp. NPDC050436 TaxID=3155659 RepID=UPI0034093F7E